MSQSESVEIQGLKELKRVLKQLPTTLRDEAVLFGTKRGAQAIARIARRRCPKGVGVSSLIRRGKRKGQMRKVHLRSTIGIKKVRMPGTNVVKYLVYAGKGSARRYAHLVEFGTKRHTIKAHSIHFIKRLGKPALRLPRGRFVHRVDHPGSRPRPFMRPAFDEGHAIAINEVVKGINQKIAKLGGKWWTK